MDLGTFEACCLPVLLVAYALYVGRGDGRGHRALEIISLAIGAWLAEDTCIAAYRFYIYSPEWSIKVGRVPLLVPLIWPMVILSSRAMADALWPSLRGVKRAVIVGCMVSFDASLIEIICVDAGFWAWFEPGYLNVPVIGILGWGVFAAIAVGWMEEKRRLGWTPLVALIGTHAVLIILWWGAFRWTLRGDLRPVAMIGFGVLAIMYASAVLKVRHSRRIARKDAISRCIATTLFLGLLSSMGGPALPFLWAHLALTALPYLAAMPRPRREVHLDST
jgi:hypothetical protein